MALTFEQKKERLIEFLEKTELKEIQNGYTEKINGCPDNNNNCLDEIYAELKKEVVIAEKRIQGELETLFNLYNEKNSYR
jgi:hypothetical protein